MAFQTDQKPVTIALFILNHIGNKHCLKGVRIRSFSGPYFPAFGLNTERYRVWKIQTRKTPNTDTSQAVKPWDILTQRNICLTKKEHIFCVKRKTAGFTFIITNLHDFRHRGVQSIVNLFYTYVSFINRRYECFFGSADHFLIEIYSLLPSKTWYWFYSLTKFSV